MAENRPPRKPEKVSKRHAGKSARRNLFGRDPEKDTTSDELAEEISEMQKQQEKNFNMKWNFDLSSDTPTEGRYNWSEPIPLDRRTPLLHVPSREEDLPRPTPMRNRGGSLSSSEFSHSITGSCSSNDETPSLSAANSSSSSDRGRPPDGTSSKRQRSPSDEDHDENPTRKSR